MLNSVQILRAAAALGVVFFHISIFFEQNLPSGFPRFETGVAGVDLFFGARAPRLRAGDSRMPWPKDQTRRIEKVLA